MKRLIFVLFIIIQVPVVLLALDKKGYIIEGKIDKLSIPATVYLVYKLNEQTEVDSCEIKNGRFSFKGIAEYPFFARLILNKDTHSTEQKDEDILKFYVEAGTIKVESNTKMSEAKVSGSPTNDLHLKYQQLLAPLRNKNDQIQLAYQQASPEKRNSKTFIDSLTAQSLALDRANADLAISFIKDHPNSIITINVLKSLLNKQSENSDNIKLFESLSSDVRNSPPGKELNMLIEKIKSVQIGALAPDFTQIDSKGNVLKLSDLRGQYTLLVFWSSGCEHCLAELSTLEKAYTKFRNRNFTILGIGVEPSDARRRWISVIVNRELGWHNVADFHLWNGETVKLYNIRNVPQNLLIDPNGKIIAKELYGDDLMSKLNEILP